MKFPSRHIFFMRFISLGEGRRRGKERSSNVRLTRGRRWEGGEGGKDEGSYANGRVPISNDFITVLPRVIGDFVSTIGGTMDVCRS